MAGSMLLWTSLCESIIAYCDCYFEFDLQKYKKAPKHANLMGQKEKCSRVGRHHFQPGELAKTSPLSFFLHNHLQLFLMNTAVVKSTCN
jgi:hypothetical protein